MKFNTPEEEIVYIGRLMFERRLLDIAGGNISCRVGDSIYISPTNAGQKWHWQLKPGQIIKAPIATDLLLESPLHSKESISHLLVYREFPMVTGIIHAHSFHVMPFCAAVKTMPAVIKSAQIYADSFEFIPETPMYSREQGEDIVKALKGKEEKMVGFAGITLMPQHGIFIAAGDLFKAADCLERMDTNAYCCLNQHQF